MKLIIIIIINTQINAISFLNEHYIEDWLMVLLLYVMVKLKEEKAFYMLHANFIEFLSLQ